MATNTNTPGERAARYCREADPRRLLRALSDYLEPEWLLASDVKVSSAINTSMFDQEVTVTLKVKVRVRECDYCGHPLTSKPVVRYNPRNERENLCEPCAEEYPEEY